MAEHRAVAIDEALAALRAGQAVVYPTETFYALGVDALRRPALECLLAIKGRDPGKPVALIAADADMAFSVATDVPPAAHRLARAFWPGPFTLVLPAKVGIPDALIGPGGGVGVRVSSHPVARALAAGLGRPLTATSANRAGEPPAVELEDTVRDLGDKIKVFVENEGGRLTGGLPSTVIAVGSGGIRLLRQGAVGEARIAAVLDSPE